MSNDKRTVVFFLVSLWVDICGLIIFLGSTYALFVHPVLEGKNLFSVNYWMEIIHSLNPIRALGTAIGFCVLLYYLIKRLPTHYKLPFLTIFTTQSIYLYSLFASRKIEWSNIASFEAKRIENTDGRDDGMLIKILEVKLILKSMEEVKFQIDTYSPKKIDIIYQLRDSTKN